MTFPEIIYQLFEVFLCNLVHSAALSLLIGHWIIKSGKERPREWSFSPVFLRKLLVAAKESTDQTNQNSGEGQKGCLMPSIVQWSWHCHYILTSICPGIPDATDGTGKDLNVSMDQCHQPILSNEEPAKASSSWNTSALYVGAHQCWVSYISAAHWRDQLLLFNFSDLKVIAHI